MTIQTTFPSGRDNCAAWLTLPDGPGPHPAVVLVHGGGATHEMMLAQYERAFSEVGIAVVAFDFRHLGESGGQPRQLVSQRRYAADVDAALAFARSRPEIDAARIAVWGTSFGSSHALTAAARHHDLVAAVVQCPVLSGRAVVTRAGARHLLRMTGPILSDVVRAAFGLRRRYVPLVGRPGERAFVNQPGALEGWRSVAPPGYVFDNRITAASGLDMLFYNASAKASKVRCPLLICACDRENLISPRIAERVADKASRAELKHYDADHFTIYHPPAVDQAIADQIRFLTTHLQPTQTRTRSAPPATRALP
ncbi:alpha/beta hydrolase [Glycomyces algeriensis]|uniref:Alpha/beta hydrolase n=1 Tax=Glycomyces algeriensis TaxID=256037 RepID=A0A9W6LG15_9ACTN|nr:alpha/beta fold hydrolase [Glycomyces algeriensis]MDA1367141.1 alpha/beta fold hydrolase [Glycomyces algeriensis]MDR7348472.1 pimeloyl-ACP methyl ester carboxylesterase [Glycomyces algeriensis]GLI41176.1 alpha/beta hydrolase [Glycomyces algeriensis]